ncbi:MAG TPA: heme NO-binding domain-containing protein [Paracoccus sp. (in: a-proteobacteria)]|nr:heme NO-binding domain-containing protein [Paracoccus sp. (in: a-proteobacteria)]
MHGMVNRSIEEFVRSTYGEAAWQAAAVACGTDPQGFHILRDYPQELTPRLLQAAGNPLAKTAAEVAEDVGAWLAGRESLRRLLRFSGTDFAEFLLSLPELPGRLRMIVPGLEMPSIEVAGGAEGYRITSVPHQSLWLCALSGMLHALADDYGCLAVIVMDDSGLWVSIPLADYAEARPFSIGGPAAGAA